MFSCLQILEAFLWFVLITLLNVTLIILTLSVSRLLDRKSGSAGMPRPISYAVFCLKKKNQACNLIPPHLVSQLARKTGAAPSARTFSNSSHVVSLLSAQW